MFFDPIAVFVLLIVVAIGVVATVLGVRRGSRPGRALGVISLVFTGIPVVMMFVPAGVVYFAVLLLPIGFITGLIGLILAAAHTPPARQAELAEARLAEEHSARVEQIRQWEAAYADAHEGQAPPAGFMPPVVAAPAAQGTNVFAILGLIFGILGGWLGIVFGFIGLSQIKHTGQGGRGIAIAGIAISFVWIAFWVLALLSGLLAMR